MFLVAHVSTGVQIYKCDGKAWTFVAPEADLVGDNGKLIISTAPGRCGRRRTAAVLRRGAGEGDGRPDRDSLAPAQGHEPTQSPTATGWRAPPSSNGSTPTAASHRRIRCNAATSGTEKRVPYKADYFFYKATGA